MSRKGIIIQRKKMQNSKVIDESILVFVINLQK